MTERIYIRANGNLVPQGEVRREGKTYSAAGYDPDGAVRLIEWTDAELAAREVDEQRWRDDPRRLPRKSSEERLEEAETVIDELKARLSALELARK